jgi:hypothetical protein
MIKRRNREHQFRKVLVQVSRKLDARIRSPEENGRYSPAKMGPKVAFAREPLPRRYLRFVSEPSLPHRLRYCLFVISWEDDLQLFSTVPCMRLERKNAESLVVAQVEVFQARRREIGDDGAERVQVSGVLARRRRAPLRMQERASDRCS